MALYRKKVDPVEAILWTGNNIDEIALFTDEYNLKIVTDPHVPACDYKVYKMMQEMGVAEPSHHLLIGDEELQVYKNEYIIKDTFGKYTSMNKDNFEIDYEYVGIL